MTYILKVTQLVHAERNLEIIKLVEIQTFVTAVFDFESEFHKLHDRMIPSFE
jgi:hypothetical protein